MNTIISYYDLVGLEKQNLQKGMNFRCNKNYSVLLMSTRSNASLDDEIMDEDRYKIINLITN
tara:strand:+ start:221 stop:406 length:186 start_codon:yes stop_codon:yes gene_type:complete